MQRISSEFAGFVRDTGVRAFDRLSERSKDVEAPLRPVLRAWTKLSAGEKNDLLDELIASVQPTESESAPARTSAKRAIRRFDPEEVEPTLPKKPRKKSTTSKKKKP